LDAGRAAEASAKGNGLVADLGRIEVASILNLHARLKLRQIEEVAAIDRQILDLGCGQNALHRRLLRVYASRSGLDRDRRGLRANLQLEVDGAVVADLHRNRGLRCGKPFCLSADCVVAHGDGTGVVEPTGVGGYVSRYAGVGPGDGYLGVRNSRPGGIRYGSINVSRGYRGL